MAALPTGGAGMLAALGGAQGPGGTGGPDELLQQIRALLEEYLAMGPDTPVAMEAQALLSAIDGGGAGAEVPPEGGGLPATEGELDSQLAAGAMMPNGEVDEDLGSYSGSDMGEAMSGAKDFLTKRNKKKTKTDE